MSGAVGDGTPPGREVHEGGRLAAETASAVRSQVMSVFVGHPDTVEQLLVAVLCGGHVLIEDVPGVGKTVLARSLAASLGCEFRRIQFTPDVLPSDITGSSVYNQRTSDFEFRPGPVFTQVLLADEINRATPRAQSALLEAMEERQVTVDGRTLPLPRPFLVLATQNPIELEGTFPLPEAQLDRFLLRLPLGYPSADDEVAILERFEQDGGPGPVRPATGPEQIAELVRLRGLVEVHPEIRRYVVAIAGATRDDERVALGASPRATLALHRAAQARALLRDRRFVLPDDIKALAPVVLPHRIVLTAQARLRGQSAAGVVDDALSEVPVPVEEEPGALGGQERR
jgi:MoxR-like ATPase